MRLIRKLVQKNLLLNKKRTIVTIVGIILSVSLLTALSTLVSSFQKSLVEYQKQKGGDFHVAFSKATKEDLDYFSKNRCIESFYIMNELGYAYLPESKNNAKPYAYFISMEQDAVKKARFHLLEGRFPQNENEIVIPRHLKTNGRMEVAVGETITLQMGERVFTDGQERIYQITEYQGENEEFLPTTTKEYTVVGIMERPGYGVEGYTAPGYTFLTLAPETSDQITVFVRFTKQGIKKQNEVIPSILGVDVELYKKIQQGGENDAIEISDEEIERMEEELSNAKYGMYLNYWLLRYENLWSFDSAMVVVLSLAIIVAIIIMVTSVYCIKNSFEISIVEKIRQYGMLSSIGATKRQIRKSVYTEASIMGVIGIIVGVVSGLFAAFILIGVSNFLLRESLNLSLVYAPSPVSIIVAVILGIVTIYFSALGSAVKAGRISPMEAIRNQQEIKVIAKKIKAPGYVKALFGIGGVISYKSIKRNKKKYRTTVVSIIICTVTFIVITYFMSMAFSLVNMVYVDEKYNLEFSLYFHDEEEEEFDLDIIKKLDHVKECVMKKNRYIYVEQAQSDFSPSYKEYASLAGLIDRDIDLNLIVLDDASFDRYAMQCGVLNAKGKGILVNEEYHEDLGKKRNQKGMLTVYRYKMGDTVKLYTQNDDMAELDENDELIPETVEKTYYDFTLAGVTDKRPMGELTNDYCVMLVVSDSTAKEKKLDLAMYYHIYIITDEADAVQDDIEQNVLPKCGENTGYSLYNRDKNAREEKSLFLLLDIFAYGLITVIALIGITSIINTINTSVELRSREFATLRSVGMTDRQFLRMIRLESFFTGGKALAIGVSLGMLISFAIWCIECVNDKVIPFKPPIFPATIACICVLVLIYVIIRLSLKGIMKRNIIETIKNENL